MILRSGIDLIEIDRLASLRPEIKARFLERVYTSQELAESGQDHAYLAGRFAAKEAVAKALGCGIGPIHWKDIEVTRGSSGEPILTLHGAAADLAREEGLTDWSISISHQHTQAVAMAVAVGQGSTTKPDAAAGVSNQL